MQVGEGIEPVHQSLCMNPAQRMASHCELSGIVTQHHGVAQEVVRVDAAPDGPLSSNLHGIWRRGQSGEAKSVEVCRPGGMISKDRFRRSGQPGDEGGRQCVVAHIGEGHVVQHEVGVAGAQQIQEVQSALRLPRAEPGEPVIADLCAEAVARLMPSSGVIDRYPR